MMEMESLILFECSMAVMQHLSYILIMSMTDMGISSGVPYMTQMDSPHLTSISYYDKNGNPCSDKDGIARISMEYKDGNQISAQYYGTDGKLCNACHEEGSYAKWIAEYNSYGWATRIRYYNSTGSLCYINGVYETQMEYDERGNCIRYTYCDFLGYPMNNREGYAVRELAFDEKGMLIYECYRDKDGSFVTGQSYANEGEYDKRGNLICAIRQRSGITTKTEK